MAIIPGQSVELVWTVRRPDGTAPDPGQVTAARTRVLRPDGTETVLTPAFSAPQTYTSYVGFPTEGFHVIRFETDGIETAWEKVYQVIPSSLDNPS